ncbi:MAG: tetratricopeptide repeat protein, partial [Roseateles sp.]
MYLALFPSDDELAALEARLQGRSAETALPLAWALRQRDTPRALELLRQAPDGPRRWLTEAECLALDGQLDAADALNVRALEAFVAAGDAVGETDAHWLGYGIALDRGDEAGLTRELHASVEAAQRAGDSARRLYLQASCARIELLQNRSAADRRWRGRLPEHSDDPVCEVALLDYQACEAALSSDFPAAMSHFIAAFDLALRTGQLRRAITLATNVGYAYTRAHDFESAIDWQRRALDLARSTRWPRPICLCLAQTGEALRLMGELDEARDMLNDCLQQHAGEPGARTVALAQSYLAQLEMDSGNPAAGLAAYEALVANPAVRSSVELQTDALQGRARALLGLQRLDEAASACAEALRMAGEQDERGRVVEILALQAEIVHAQGDPAGALSLYNQALDEAEALPGYRPPLTLLDGAARAHAALGQFQQAFDLARRAITLREISQSEEARKRTRAIQVQHQIDRARRESEHLRRLAASEAARSAALEDAHAVLQQLSAMGQELTAELDIGRVLSLLRERIDALVDAWRFRVYLVQEGEQVLACEDAAEEGQPSHALSVRADDADSEVARCARERRERLLDDGPGEVRSQVLMPLSSGSQLVGVLCLQSREAGAYGERELLILRNLAAYAAIALENAHAYQRVSALQRQVMAQEKLAALGAMVAGVAHELNTPIGNSLLAATTLLAANRDLERRLNSVGALRKSELVQQTRVTLDGLELIERSMLTAANLVSNFKQMAQGKERHERQSFDLATWCALRLKPLSQLAEQAGHVLDIAVPPDIRLDSYPEPLGQALEILVGNALLHGLATPPPGRPGRIEISARPLDAGGCRIEVADNGRGMSEQVLRRVFEPFFSTRFGQGGNG